MQTDIRSKSLLVKLSIGLPGNSRKDKPITSEVIAAHALGQKAGRWVKQLYPEEALEPIAKLASEARTFNDKHALPWIDEGWRILSSDCYLEHTAKLRDFKSRFKALAESHFIARLPEWMEWARQTHNGTFNPADYPPADSLRRKFTFKLDCQPVPSGQDFRCQVSDEDRRSLDERVTEAVQLAQADLWNRLAAPLRAMVSRLKEPNATFRDSLVENLRDIILLIPQLNLTNDSALEAFKTEAASLATANPQTLRDNKPARAHAAAQAQSILDRMATYLVEEDHAGSHHRRRGGRGRREYLAGPARTADGANGKSQRPPTEPGT